MELIVKKKKIARLNLFIDWLIYMVAYAIILLIVSLIFKKTIQIDSSYYGFWGLITSIIIYLLNDGFCIVQLNLFNNKPKRFCFMFFKPNCYLTENESQIVKKIF
jgi:hypothetical protein